MVSRWHIFVVYEDMLLRPAVAVGEGAGIDRRSDAVHFHCCCSHLYGYGFGGMLVFYVRRSVSNREGTVICASFQFTDGGGR